MANFLEDKNRRVIPNWRSFNKTSHLGELDSFNIKNNISRIDLSILDYIDAWNQNNELIYASDLLSAAVVNNLTNNSEVIKAANFILDNFENATTSQIKLANSILEKKEVVNFTDDFLNINSNSLLELSNPDIIKQRIKFIRDLIKLYPYNSIHYIELSRYYSILNLKEKAINAMKIALHLSKDNRFVLRSAVRLFTHFDDVEYAHNLLRKNSLTNIDPWLLSAEISLATVRNRNSVFIKKGIELVNSKNINPFSFTELASSIGTVELINGSHKKSREFFNKSLISPNDNSLAQLEWASNEDNSIQVDPSKFQVQLNFEALSLDSFHNANYDEALNFAAKWFIDMPFSKRPLLFASNLASTVMKEHKKAILFLNAGLKNRPQDTTLINNIAYSLSLDGRPIEAIEYLNKINPTENLTAINEICLKATKGLALYRSGMPDVGRNYYLQALKMAKEKKLNNLHNVALLNYAREEIRIKAENASSLLDVVNKIPISVNDIDLKYLKADVDLEFLKFNKPK